MGHIAQPKIEVDGIPLRVLDSWYSHPDAAWFHRAVHEGSIYAATHDHQLPQTLFWDFLRARYEIDPRRFTHWHPLIGKLEREANTHTCDTIPPNIPPGCISVVPEPSSVILCAMAILCYFIKGKLSYDRTS